jgi:beta-phosphoglucomutase
MLRALLLDLDGTLVHTNPVHLEAWRDTLGPHGLHIDQAYYVERISGRRNHDIVRELFPGISDADNLEIRRRKEARFRDLAVDLVPLAGAPELLAWARAHDVLSALVTNAPRANAEVVLRRAGLEGRLDAIVLAEDAGAGKPDPAPYRLALARLGATPATALAFEDSPTGVIAAAAAGVRVVGLATSHAVQELARCGADPIVADFHAPALWRILHDTAAQ